MAKKKDTKAKDYKESTPILQGITSTLENNFMPYAMSVIVSRAIPEIDGFKPAHRKLLYMMYTMGLLTGSRSKSADIVGSTMRLNPHGDAAIYETMVRLTTGHDALLHPFVDSKGNFGKTYSRDMAYAASRYTEAKLAPICAELFSDIDKDTVDFVDNYNGKMKEPTLFPTTYPNLLVTPNMGIAVGMASNVCSFNLREVCAATIAYIKNKNVDLLQYLTAPDFTTGGDIIYNEDELRRIYETGRGSFKIRARYRYDKKNSCIEVYEIPYTTSIEAIIDKIAVHVKAGKLREITDVRNETDLGGLKLAIDIKRNADPEALMKRLYSMTPLLDSFGCNFNFLIKGYPRTMGIKQILDEWLEFRSECIKRRTVYDLQKAKDKLHLLTGLSKILIDIDKAIKIIRQTEEDKLVIPNLMKGFDIDRIQAEYVAEIRLRNLNKEHLLKRLDELDKLKEEIAGLEDILSHQNKVHNIIIKELKAVSKKYGKDRKSGIVYVLEQDTAPQEVYIDDYGLKFFLTEHNYLKKVSLASLRASDKQSLKDGDRIIQELETTNKCDVLLFSNKQNVYKLKAHEIPDCKASSMGEFLTNLLGSEEGERIIYIAVTTDYSGYMLFGFENGKFAKVNLNSYATKTNRRKLVNAYSSKSAAVFIYQLAEDNVDFLAVRGNDRAALFNSNQVPLFTAKNAVGVQVIKLKKNSAMTVVFGPGQFTSDDLEYYRIDALPGSGHFITEKDKRANELPGQIGLS